MSMLANGLVERMIGELPDGHPLDDVLADFARLPPAVYRAVGAADFDPHAHLHVLAGGRRE